MVPTSAAETYGNNGKKERKEQLALLSEMMLTKKKSIKRENSPVICLEMTDISLDWGKGHSKGWGVGVNRESFLTLRSCVGSWRQL